jgi:hypothetical protein
MKRLLCIFGHVDTRRFVLQPLGHDLEDPTMMQSILHEEITCIRCGRVKTHEEMIPLQYIVSDD